MLVVFACLWCLQSESKRNVIEETLSIVMCFNCCSNIEFESVLGLGQVTCDYMKRKLVTADHGWNQLLNSWGLTVLISWYKSCSNLQLQFILFFYIFHLSPMLNPWIDNAKYVRLNLDVFSCEKLFREKSVSKESRKNIIKYFVQTSE